MTLISLNTPSEGVKTFLKDKLVTILKRKQSNTGKSYRSLSNNVYYINLDDTHLLLMYETADNDNTLDNYDVEYDETDTTYYLKFTNDGGSTYVDVPTLYPATTSLDDIYCHVVDCSPDYVDLESVQSIPGEKTFSLQKLNTAINDTGTNKFIVMDGNGQISPATMTLNDFNVAVGTPPDMSSYLAKDDIYKSSARIQICDAGEEYVISDPQKQIVIGSANYGTGGFSKARDSICIGFGIQSGDDGDTYRNVAIGVMAKVKQDDIAIGKEPQALGTYCVAIGYEAQATDIYGTALGYRAKSVSRAIAIGPDAKCNAGNCVAIGRLAIADNINSICLGNESTSTGDYAIAMGYQAQARGESCVAIGKNAQVAEEGFSIAMGIDANSSGGMGAISIGPSSNALNANTLAIGGSAQATADYAIAMGYQTQGTAVNCVAIGKEASASRDNAIAIGVGAVAEGINNTIYRPISIGGWSNANGHFALAIGADSVASADYATAMGYQAQATTVLSIAIGKEASATLDGSVTIGPNSSGNSIGSSALGLRASATGERSIAIGSDATTSADYATAMGFEAEGIGSHSIALGYRAKSNNISSCAIGVTAVTNADRQASFGQNAGNYILTSHTISLHSHEDASGNGRGVFIKCHTNQTDFRMLVGCQQKSVDTEFGNTTDQLKVWGNIYATGTISGQTITQRSDERLKTNIMSLSHYSLNDILKLRPVEFRWKDLDAPKGEQYGFIAQEVEQVMPELVDNSGSHKSLKYTSLIPMLVKSIQEQNSAIETLKAENKELRAEINELKNKLI